MEHLGDSCVCALFELGNGAFTVKICKELGSQLRK